MPLPVSRRLRRGVGFAALIGCNAVGCGGARFNANGHDLDGSTDGSSGGTSTGGAGFGGTDQRDASAGGTAGARGGAGGFLDAGAGGRGGSSGSTGSSGAGTGDACAAVHWFPDGDGDRVGRSSGAVTACSAPATGWVTTGGDCNDDNALVHPANPDPPNFAATGYVTSGSTTSFDYDCDGFETPDPSQFGSAPNCSGLALGNCAGAGFVATSRTGTGTNAICGSTTLRTCKSNGVLCSGVVSTVEAKRCR